MAQLAMDSIEREVLAETHRFEAALPELLKDYRGRWVVFQGGALHSVHETEDQAYVAAVEHFGVTGGSVVAPVLDKDSPAPNTTSVVSFPS